MSGFKQKIGSLTRADQMNADFPRANLIGAKMSRTNLHKVDLGTVEIRDRAGHADQSDARQKFPNPGGAFHQFGVVQQQSLSQPNTACVRNVIHSANDVIRNHVKSRIAGYTVSGT